MTLICEALDYPRSTYYRRKKTEKRVIKRENGINPDDELIIEEIKQIKRSHLFWGYRRIWAWLNYRSNIKINKKRVYRLMKSANLLVPQKRYRVKRKQDYKKPTANRPNQWWGTDMTKFYVNGFGWLYLVIILDWYTKRVVGYTLGSRSTSRDWINALEQAVLHQCPEGSREYRIHLMSDNGSQPTSITYMKACSTLGIDHITTSYSNPKGNADTERFMRTFKEEVIWPTEFESTIEAEKAVKEFIWFYNHDYIHSSLGYKSPVEFENEFNAKKSRSKAA